MMELCVVGDADAAAGSRDATAGGLGRARAAPRDSTRDDASRGVVEFRTNRVCRHVLSDLRIRTNCASTTLVPPQGVAMPPLGDVMVLGAVSSGTRRTNRVCRHVLRRSTNSSNCASSGTLVPPQGVVMPPLGDVNLIRWLLGAGLVPRAVRRHWADRRWGRSPLGPSRMLVPSSGTGLMVSDVAGDAPEFRVRTVSIATCCDLYEFERTAEKN